MNIAKALLLISACLVAGSTFAADDKTWSSVACRGYGLNTSDSELTFQNAGLYNPQNNYETVICPIEMDREGGWGTTSNVDQADINVSFRMGSVPAKAGCTLYRTSGTTTSAIGGYTSPSNYSPNSLNRITIRNTASTFDEQGLALVCSMGPKVAITSINLQEWGLTDDTAPL